MKRLQFRLSTLLISATLIALCLWAFFGPGEVSIRSASGKLLVAHEDILSVDWPSQDYYLSKRGMDKLVQSQIGLTTPFQVWVNDDVIYTGNIVSCFSSYIPAGPTIHLGPTVEYKKPVRIYNTTGGKDLWGQHRIRTSLRACGKLKKRGG